MFSFSFSLALSKNIQTAFSLFILRLDIVSLSFSFSRDIAMYNRHFFLRIFNDSQEFNISLYSSDLLFIITFVNRFQLQNGKNALI